MLSTPVQFVRGVGPDRARILAALGIETVEDLLHHYPRRHEDRSRLVPFDLLKPGDTATVGGQVFSILFRRMRGRLSLTTVTLVDGTGDGGGLLELCFWNQPFRKRQFQEGDRVVATGKVELKGGLRMVSPEVEKIPDEEDGETDSAADADADAEAEAEA